MLQAECAAQKTSERATIKKGSGEWHLCFALHVTPLFPPRDSLDLARPETRRSRTSPECGTDAQNTHVGENVATSQCVTDARAKYRPHQNQKGIAKTSRCPPIQFIHCSTSQRCRTATSVTGTRRPNTGSRCGPCIRIRPAFRST